MTAVTAIILAAGMGTRMKSALPKVMHKVAFAPMLEHVLQNCSFSSNTVVVANNILEENKNFLNLLENYKADVVIQKQLNGTAGAVEVAINDSQTLAENILITMGDAPLLKQSTLELAYKNFIETGADIQVLTFEANNPYGYGRVIINSNKVTKIVEEKDADTNTKKLTLCNSGIYFVKLSALQEFIPQISNNNSQKEKYLTDIIGIAVAHNKAVSHFSIDELEAQGVNSKVQLAFAESELQKRLRLMHMENGVTLIDPQSVFFSLNTEIGKDVTIYPNVIMEGSVKIADNVVVYSNTNLSDCEIHSDSSIGPFARIRPKTIIGKACKVGNFVEAKNAKLSERVKASHLTYLGDITIGKNTNIGAGTIVCNYDGVDKHHSTIGKESFIGSNTAIISPIKIGDEVLVGAGSVITKDVPPKSLAIARAEQSNLQYNIKKKKI